MTARGGCDDADDDSDTEQKRQKTIGRGWMHKCICGPIATRENKIMNFFWCREHNHGGVRAKVCCYV